MARRIDPETGFPPRPEEGMYWEVRSYAGQPVVELHDDHVCWSAYGERPSFKPRYLRRLAHAAIRNRARNRRDESVMGTYPPKRLGVR